VRGVTRIFTVWGALLVTMAASGTPAAADFPDVAAKVQAGTVMIESGKGKELRFGSGFFLETPAVVITALHVVEGSKRIRVALPGSFLTSDALLLGAVPRWDLAVLKVAWPETVESPGLRLAAEGGDLPVGTEIAYTGYGFGVDDEFATVLSTYRGIISSHIPSGEGLFYHLSGLVSTGMSGCALYLPGSGEVVGVVTRHFGPEALSMGFGGAVPVAVLKKLLDGILIRD